MRSGAEVPARQRILLRAEQEDLLQAMRHRECDSVSQQLLDDT